MDISDDELLNLPDDPKLAFVQFEQTLRNRVLTAIDSSQGYGIESLQLDYINQVLAIVRALDLEVLTDWEVPQVSCADYEIAAAFRQLMADVTHYTVQIRIKNSRRIKRYSVALDVTAKKKIRHYLGKIKEIIDRLEVSPKKKEDLYRKVAALENELNRDRTSFGAAMALILEAAETGGEAGRRLEPIRKLIDSVTGVFKAAKDEEDATSHLLEPADGKRINGPMKALSPPRSQGTKLELASSQDLDDDIPF